ncbi:MAG TPA: hypothetical protein VGR13_07595, partial [Actinomycetota bacterium]|nr:hypothetical protein [Actinomycetota bacterium]
MRGPPLVKKHVRSWLSRFEPDDTVGIAREEDACPLTLYLRKQLGYSTARVYRECWTVESVWDGDIEYELPGWAQDFIDAIDVRGHHGLSRDE